ncbi:hypothetical protein EPIR_0720 [Erwinia piriflorinigrans CFBP 5888]|uniref:Uncharacterized protein n=1 Tax=Erwinia piriflorinigrans CFBP 5888 TaxID=1161919 RepID=V5Z447_9GAMM|nr:hypothetical protein EPIR_0720 [Erwinia piriflorinigrans CFBP 5888]
MHPGANKSRPHAIHPDALRWKIWLTVQKLMSLSRSE